MKLRDLFALAAFLCCVLLPAAAFADTEDAAGGPVAEVTAPNYTFPLVVDGTEVVHNFVMKNRGTAVLEIMKIKTG